jgi:fermentation-respiration switch protein FrsA (DUF1100 family)
MIERAAMRILSRHPEIARASIYTAVVCGDLEQFESLAQDLVFACESGHPSAIERLNQHYRRRLTWDQLRTEVRERLNALDKSEKPAATSLSPHSTAHRVRRRLLRIGAISRARRRRSSLRRLSTERHRSGYSGACSAACPHISQLVDIRRARLAHCAVDWKNMPRIPGWLLLVLLMRPLASWGAGVAVRFDPANPTIGPFPTDFLTVPDPAQKTSLRVNLPLPDCGAQPSACAEVIALNELDGFALQPRIRIQFSGAIDPATLKSGIQVVWLDNLTTEEKGLGAAGKLTAVNQVIYDPAAQTAYAQPDDFFDQHRRYALLVTDAVKDTLGDPVQADPAFRACTQQPDSAYCTALQSALSDLATRVAPRTIVAASIFTTMSATSWLEKARDTLAQSGPIQITRVGGQSVKASGIASVNWHAQVKANPAGFEDFPVTIPAAVFAGVDRIVFNSYKSPRFLNERQLIPNTPTGADLKLPVASDEVQVHTFVPSSAMPANGYPVIIFGHGFAESGFQSPTLVASAFAKAGFAVLAIHAVGHGYGPQSVFQLIGADGKTVDLPGGGRGVDLDGDGRILDYEGCVVSAPAPSALRDCLRQTVVDLMQLARGIRGGALLEDASGVRLDPSRIYYTGFSLGAIYGTMLQAVDPNIQVAALSSGGGSIADITRWTGSAYLRDIVRGIVGTRTPSLLNAGADFNDNYVLRNQPAKVNGVDGAIELQNLFATIDWLQAGGDPLSYAPHLKLSPLANLSAKKTLFLIAEGDRTVPNPQNSALIRAAGALDTTSVFRNDLVAPLAQLLGQPLPADPHAFLVNISSISTGLVADAAQTMVAGFLDSNGAVIPDVNAQARQLLRLEVFETPKDYLETLNW